MSKHRNSKTVLCTITAPCSYVGQQFILKGKRHIEHNGFRSSYVYRCCNGKRKDHKGCAFKYVDDASVGDIPMGLPQEIIDFLVNVAYILSPVITATKVDTGETLEMNTNGDMRARGFVPNRVRAVINKDKPYNGWVFTRKEPTTTPKVLEAA